MIHRIARPRFFNPRTETIWQTIYADMITNLVLVFLSLYGLTVMGDDALSQAMRSMKWGEIPKSVAEGDSLTFDEVPTLLRTAFEGLDSISIDDQTSVIRLTFGEALLFGSGSANLREEAVPHLLLLSHYIQKIPFTVIVEGHTDNVPIAFGGAFHSNRELSMARAMTIIRWLTDSTGFSADRFAAAAYGEFKPLTPNDTDAGRKVNRRVEIVFMKDLPYPPLAAIKSEGKTL